MSSLQLTIIYAFGTTMIAGILLGKYCDTEAHVLMSQGPGKMEEDPERHRWRPRSQQEQWQLLWCQGRAATGPSSLISRSAEGTSTSLLLFDSW